MVQVQSQKELGSFSTNGRFGKGYAKESSKVDFVYKHRVAHTQWSLQKKVDCVADNDYLSQSVENYL